MIKSKQTILTNKNKHKFIHGGDRGHVPLVGPSTRLLLAALQPSSLHFIHAFSSLFLLMCFQALFGTLGLPKDFFMLLPEGAERHFVNIPEL